jgi:hypothetical protein
MLLPHPSRRVTKRFVGGVSLPTLIRTLIAASLVVATCRGETEYSKALGGDDDVLVRYSVLSVGDTHFLVGKIYNRSRYPLRCQVAADDTLKREIRFNPGDAKDIKGGVPFPKVVVFWDIKCSVPMHYKVAEKIVFKAFPGGRAGASVTDSEIVFVVDNVGNGPVEMNWPGVSIIGTDQGTQDIARRNPDENADVPYQLQPLLPVTIPPNANLHSGVIPAINARGEHSPMMLPGEVRLDRVAQVIQDSKGKRLGLYLDLMAEGKRIPVTVEFRVIGAETVPWTESRDLSAASQGSDVTPRDNAASSSQQNAESLRVGEANLDAAVASMPSPTGYKQIDQDNWKLWLQQNPSVQGLVPPWSPSAYSTVRAMAAAQK